MRGLHSSGLEIVEVEAPPIERTDLALVHDPTYIDNIESFCESGGGALDMDTYVVPSSWEAALRSAGAVRVLVDLLEESADVTGFAVSRPPGHHALSSRAMGFCIFNNVAITARLLRARGSRVAVLDWDVHHGNGTQAMLIDDPGLLYVSLHQDPFYPYEGDIEDIEEDAKGTTINIPLPFGTAGDVYRRAWSELVLPVVKQFRADWVLVSAGFDAHVDDPLGGLSMVAEDYGHLTAGLAEVHPANRVIMTLEGGYDLDALEASARASIQGLVGVGPVGPPLRSPALATEALTHPAQAIARHWKV